MAKALASSLSGSAWAKALDQIEIVLNLHFVAQFVVSFSFFKNQILYFPLALNHNTTGSSSK